MKEQDKCARCNGPVKITEEMRAAAKKLGEANAQGYLCDECILEVVRATARRKKPVVRK